MVEAKVFPLPKAETLTQLFPLRMDDSRHPLRVGGELILIWRQVRPHGRYAGGVAMSWPRIWVRVIGEPLILT